MHPVRNDSSNIKDNRWDTPEMPRAFPISNGVKSKIERQVMAGVGTIYAARQLVSMTALKLYVCALSLYGIGRLVWVSHVFENWANVGLQGTLQFVTAAVFNAHLPVQIALVVLAVAGVSLVRDLLRAMVPANRLAF